MVCTLLAGELSAGLAALARARLSDGSAVSVRALARRAGVSQPLMANWLDGRRGLSLASFEAVRVALGAGWCEVVPCGLNCEECRGARRVA
jgi:transcriptional regulator with XRE-family HTH domain